MEDMPVAFVIRNDGKINTGSSQNKTGFFNVEGHTIIEGSCNLTSGHIYKINGVKMTGTYVNYSSTVTINTKIDSKQDILTFGKSNTNSLKLEEGVLTNDILLIMSDGKLRYYWENL